MRDDGRRRSQPQSVRPEAHSFGSNPENLNDGSDGVDQSGDMAGVGSPSTRKQKEKVIQANSGLDAGPLSFASVARWTRIRVGHTDNSSTLEGLKTFQVDKCAISWWKS